MEHPNVSFVALRTTPALPPGQYSQICCPLFGWNVPAWHAVHVVLEYPLANPGSQDLHTSIPSKLILPYGQYSQRVLAFPENAPAGQSLHTSVPQVSLYLPGTHPIHTSPTRVYPLLQTQPEILVPPHPSLFIPVNRWKRARG